MVEGGTVREMRAVESGTIRILVKETFDLRIRGQRLRVCPRVRRFQEAWLKGGVVGSAISL